MKKFALIAACFVGLFALSATADAGWRHRCCQEVVACDACDACDPCACEVRVVGQPVRNVLKALLPPYRRCVVKVCQPSCEPVKCCDPCTCDPCGCRRTPVRNVVKAVLPPYGRVCSNGQCSQ